MSFQHGYPYGDVHELNLDWIMQTMQEFINSEREAGHTPTVSSVRSFFTHKYPYGDIHELNLDWVIQTALRMEEIGDSVDGDIGELKTRMTTAEGNISALENTVGGLSDSVGQIETEIEDIQGNVEDLQATAAQHTTQIAALDQKIDTQVVANPADAATGTLSKIEIAGTVYTVEGSGGSEVEANPTGEATDTLQKIGIDGTIYEVGGSSEPVSKTVTGNPINITDAADAPIVSGEVTFEPQQDLHGYGKPWAGGTGKNLLKNSSTSKTENGITFTVNADGTVTANGTATETTFLAISVDTSTVNGDLLFNGAIGGSGVTYNAFMWDVTSGGRCKKWDGTSNSDNGFTNLNEVQIIQGHTVQYRMRVHVNQTVDNVKFYPMICASSETDPTFEPYSNICPITGYTDCELEVKDDATSPTVTNTYTTDLDGTRYGGKVYPVTGKMSVGMGHIASYAGETIGEPWLSDRDQYVAGTTPSTGAEVVYTLATPLVVQLTPEQIRTLEDTNNISTNMTSMSLEYITQDYQPLVKLIEQSAGHHYSTQERVVGTWFGKPLYEKVVDFGALPNATAKDLNHNISDIDTVFITGGYAKNTTSGFVQQLNVPVPSNNQTDMQSQWYFGVTATYIRCFTLTDRTSYDECKVILQYTKNTD